MAFTALSGGPGLGPARTGALDDLDFYDLRQAFKTAPIQFWGFLSIIIV